MADYLGGYSSEWEVREVVTGTWGDGPSVEGVVSVSVDRSNEDDVPLLETGSMTVDADSLPAMWCRVYMRVDQGGSERVPMATLLFERTTAHVEKGVRQVTANGRSVLQPAADVKMPYGAFCPAGVDGAAYAGRLISSCTPAPVNVEGSFTLVDDYVFDIGSSNLEAAWKLVKAADWCIQVDGDGMISIRPKPTEPALDLSMANAGLLIPGVDDDFSIADVPNRYFAIDDDKRAEATNEDPDSRASYQARGRWVDVVDTSPALVDGESLEMYAQRKLAEASVVTRTYSYDREFWPGVVPFSLVKASLPAHGIEGELRVATQRLECGKGVRVTETACEEVRA